MHEERLYIGTGIFVVGALLLAIIGTIFIYNQYLLGKTETYVMFFQGSLNGLNATSAITYRGVKIGEVRRIELTATKSQTNVSIPVYVEFFVEKSFEQRGDPIQILIDNGVVATIASANILTGTASIELMPAETKKPALKVKTFHGYRLFPTETTVEGESTANATLKTARTTFKDISSFIKSKEFKDTITAIQSMANSINHFSEVMTDEIPDSLVYFNTSLKYLNSSLNYFDDSLKEISKAAYSIRNLSDYIARHPESILRGR